MTGDGGYVTHDPNHSYIMKEALAQADDEGEGKYCRLQSTPTEAIPGK